MTTGKVIQFRRGRKTITERHFLIEIENVSKKEEAQKFVGKGVIWKSPAGKEINGKIAATHGNKGVVRAIFERGLPGQAVTTKVEIKKMATLRKANAYSKRTVVPYTRVSKRKNRSYIKVVPPQKIVKFSMGEGKIYETGKFPHRLALLTTENVQIRHNSLEACRQYVNKVLDKNLLGQYFFRVVPFPHHIQRENKMLTGAGADRMQTGMQLSFGKCIGKSAILKPNSEIFFIAVSTPKAVVIAREAFSEIKSKLPCKTRVLYEFTKE